LSPLLVRSMPQVPVTLDNVTLFAVTFVTETALRDNVHTMSAEDGNGSVRQALAGETQENTLTIEQLAAESGMTVRNIRSHRARGLLPAPEVRDRVGYYGPQHVTRLRLIQELQSEGFNLKGIERLLEQSPGPAEQFLSFKRALGASFETEEPQAFTRQELADRFGDDTGDALKQGIASGALVPIGDDRFEARVPSLLDAAEGVLAQGVPLNHALAVLSKVQDRCSAVAREFVRLFLEDVWKPFEEAGYPEDRWPEVRESLDQLRPLSSQALMGIYQMTMADEVDAAFGKQLERLSRSKR
jgi:DNA-binding transcriptional MerR regulator